MRLKFTPTDSMKAYYGDCPDGTPAHCPHEGIYDVPDDKAKQLLSDFPANFQLTEGSKAERGPTSDRSEPKPSRNK